MELRVEGGPRGDRARPREILRSFLERWAGRACVRAARWWDKNEKWIDGCMSSYACAQMCVETRVYPGVPLLICTGLWESTVKFSGFCYVFL